MIEIDLLLAWGGEFKKVCAGEIISTEDQLCSFYNQLISGKLRWVNVNEDGTECIHSIVEAGESFGELSLFDDLPNAGTAIAEEACLLIRLHKPIFIELIKQNSEIHFAFTRLLSKRLRFKMAIIQSFASGCPEIRIATILKYFRTENKHFCGPCDQLNLTRQQIADMTGLRVETVIRTMRIMHDKGKLVIEKGKVFCGNMIKYTLT